MDIYDAPTLFFFLSLFLFSMFCFFFFRYHIFGILTNGFICKRSRRIRKQWLTLIDTRYVSSCLKELMAIDCKIFACFSNQNANSLTFFSLLDIVYLSLCDRILSIIFIISFSLDNWLNVYLFRYFIIYS